MPVADHMTSEADIVQVEKSFGFSPGGPNLNSVELYMRNLTVHHASVLVFKNGRLDSQVIVGIKEEDEIEKIIKSRLEEML